MTEYNIKEIIARLAQPDPLPNLVPLCPDRQQLLSILLNLRKGARSPFYADICEEANRQHLDVRYLVRKTDLLLSTLNISSSKDYYSILGLTRNASTGEIHKQWIEKMRTYHPDNFEDPTGWIAEQCWNLNEAYAVLKDPEKRQAYDKQRRKGTKSVLDAPEGSHSMASRGDIVTTSAVSRSRLTRAMVLGAIVIAGLIVGMLLWSSW